MILCGMQNKKTLCKINWYIQMWIRPRMLMWRYRRPKLMQKKSTKKKKKKKKKRRRRRKIKRRWRKYELLGSRLFLGHPRPLTLLGLFTTYYWYLPSWYLPGFLMKAKGFKNFPTTGSKMVRMAVRDGKLQRTVSGSAPPLKKIWTF